MALSKPKLPLLPLFLLIMLLANKVHSQGTPSFAFNFSESQPRDLTYQGDAHFPPGLPSLRLTRTDRNGIPLRDRVGRVLDSRPAQFWTFPMRPFRQLSFVTTIKFRITRRGNDPADGIAFFIAPNSSTIPSGSTGGNLGIFDSSGTSPSLFAVEFDTYVNSEWDPNYRHIGININSRSSRNVTRFENAFSQVVTARIAYDSFSRKIVVVVTSASETVTLSSFYNLRTVLPQYVQVGISASTGDEVAIHDILYWSFTSDLVLEPLDNIVDSSNNVEYDKNNKEETYIKQYV